MGITARIGDPISEQALQLRKSSGRLDFAKPTRLPNIPPPRCKVGSHPSTRPGTPCDTQRRQSEAPPEISEGIELGIGCGIHTLPRSAEHYTGRRIQDKKLQRNIASDFVQYPGPIDFSAKYLSVLLPNADSSALRRGRRRQHEPPHAAAAYHAGSRHRRTAYDPALPRLPERPEP